MVGVDKKLWNYAVDHACFLFAYANRRDKTAAPVIKANLSSEEDRNRVLQKYGGIAFGGRVSVKEKIVRKRIVLI
jgi:hypothetical protein